MAGIDAHLGSVKLWSELDFDLSPGTGVGGHPALVYNSSTVDVRPILTVALPTSLLPTSIDVQLTWDGTPQSWVNFSTAGRSAGDTYLLSVQVASPVAASGVYPWSMRVVANGTAIDQTVGGELQVVVNDASPFGAGWWLDGLDRLVTTAGGQMYVYGGGSRLFVSSGATTFTSPADDFGTLVQNIDGSFTYTAKGQTERHFDAAGKLTRVVDPHGLALTYTYDHLDRLTGVAAPDGGATALTYATGSVSIAEPGGRTYALALSGGLAQITDVDGTTRAFTYDAGGRVTSDSWSPLTTGFGYGTHGRLTQVTRGSGTAYDLAPAQTRGLATSPAALGWQLVATLTDPLNAVTTYTLDAAGRLLKQTDADGAVRTWSRNAAGQVSSHVDPRGNATVYAYNGHGDLTAASYPDGGRWSYGHDGTFHKVTATSNSEGATTSASLNAYGDVTSYTDGVGATSTYAYDGTGLMTAWTNGRGHTTTMAHDGNRRLTSGTDPLGHSTAYSYNGHGNPTAVTDPLGHVWGTGYDARNRVTAQSDGLGNTTSYAYDPYGHVTGATDPRGFATAHGYDNRGWLTLLSEPEGRTTAYAYDAAGKATAVTDPNGWVTTYTFDPVGRALTMLRPISAGTTALTSYAYDLSGNLTRVTDPLSELARRGVTSYMERLVLTREARAPWRMGHGSPAPMELIAMGCTDLVICSIRLVRELIAHERFVFVASEQARRALLMIGQALDPLEYCVIGTLKHYIEGAVEDWKPAHAATVDLHWDAGDAAPTPARDWLRRFRDQVAPNVVFGLYRATRLAPPQLFFAHVKHFHTAARIALADSVHLEQRGFPMLIDIADGVCRSVYGGGSLREMAEAAYARAGAPYCFQSERTTRFD